MKNLNFDKIESLDATKLLCAFNDLCEDAQMFDDKVYAMADLDDLYSSPWEAARAFFFGYRYNPYATDQTAREQSSPCDDYFYYNGYGNICSIQEYDLTKYILSNLDRFDEEDIICTLANYFDDEEDYLDITYDEEPTE